MITGKEFISLAGKWAVLEGGEASWRTAVSRAYYGAFHCAQELLREIGVPDPVSMENRHVFVQQALIASGNSSAYKAGVMLGSLHEDRKDADYDLSSSLHRNPQFARDCVEEAVTIQSLLLNCGGPTEKSAMRDEILAWKQRVRK